MPVKFSGITGQEKALRVLTAQIDSGKVPHAYLFSGPGGVGKRTAALEFAKALECLSDEKPCGTCGPCVKIDKGLHPDVRVMDLAWQAALLEEEPEKQTQFKIDSIRELQKEISLKPVEGRYRVFIIDPAEKMNQEAANCFLKTLEEPPAGSVIILISTLREGLPKTVVSRCQNIGFRPLSKNEVAGILSKLHGGESSGYANIVRYSGGSVSRAVEFMGEYEGTGGAGGITPWAAVWNEAKAGKLEPAMILEENGHLFSKRPGTERFMVMLLAIAQSELEEGGETSFAAAAAEKIIYYRRALRYNVNPALAAGVLLYELSGISRGA
jgi:DNA polymerase-3 subunit delta'